MYALLEHCRWIEYPECYYVKEAKYCFKEPCETSYKRICVNRRKIECLPIPEMPKQTRYEIPHIIIQTKDELSVLLRNVIPIAVISGLVYYVFIRKRKSGYSKVPVRTL